MAERLLIYHTGADATDRPQPDALACLGGLRSSTRVLTLETNRLAATQIPSLRIDHVGAGNTRGNGVIEATGAATLRWAAPGDSPGGEVTITAGTPATLHSGAGAALVVTLTEERQLGGMETVQLLDVINNAIGGRNVTEAESTAGEDIYAGIILVAGEAIDNLDIWIDADSWAGVALGTEELDVEGGIQTIADDTTAPVDVTFSTPTSGSPLAIGSLAAGEGIGLWIRRTIGTAAAASAINRIILGVSYDDADETTYTEAMRGIFRIAAADTEGYEVYAKEGERPNPDVDSPVHTATSAPLTWDADYTEGTWYENVYYRNRFGVLGAVLEVPALRIDGDGDPLPVPPQGPAQVIATPAANGAVTVDMIYYPFAEGETDAEIAANRATHFLVWWTGDGTTPDPDNDTPDAVLAMSGGSRVHMRTTTDEFIDNAPVNIVVATKRVIPGEEEEDPDIETQSEASTLVTVTVSTLGPVRPRASALLGQHYGIQLAPMDPPESPDYIDQPNSIYFQHNADGVSLYADTVLCWRVIATGDTPRLYIPSEIDPAEVTISGAAPDTGIDTSEYVADGEIFVPVNSVRRARIDIGGRLEADEIAEAQTLPDIDPGAAYWPRYGDTLFCYWDRAAERWTPYLQLTSAGRLNSAFPINNTNDQSTIEGY